jgi:phage terminase small subunit
MAVKKSAAAAVKKRDTKNPLTEKQQAFIVEYLIDRNATQAAIRAGYSKASAGQRGFECLNNPIIRAKIDAALEASAQRVEIDRDWVLSRAKDMAEDAEASNRDRLKAMELICKLLGLFEQQQQDTRIEVVLGEAEDWCG